MLRTVFCGGVGIPHWTVATDGAISCCTRDNAPEMFTFGHFDENLRAFVSDDARLARIRSLNVFSYPECQDCFCKYHCAGDCADLRLSNLHNCQATMTLGAYWLNRKIDQLQPTA